MKLLKRIVPAILVLFLVTAGALLVITYAYQNEVKEYMIQELNNHLKTKVIVDSKNIRLSLFKNFPYASLGFKKVSMLEAPISNSKPDKKGNRKFLKQDTLFVLENISLQFNIMDILQKKYVVRKVFANNGKVKLRIGVDGSQNWDVWKGSDDTTSTVEESAFDINKFNMENITLRYVDLKNRNDIFCAIRSGTIGGKFTSKQYDLSIKGDLFVSRFKLDSVNYLDSKPVRMDFALQVDNDRNQYEFSDAFLYVADLKIAVQGKYVVNDKKAAPLPPRRGDSENSAYMFPPSGGLRGASDFIDISLKGKDMDIQSVLSLLPEKYHKHINDYDSDGEFYCNAHIKGKIEAPPPPETCPELVSGGGMLEVKADFGITKAEITQLSSGIILKDVHLLGNFYSSSSKEFLMLKTFSASLANGTVSGNLRIDNFSSPMIETSLSAHLLLDDVRHFLKIDTLWNEPIESLAGNMKVNMEYKGRLNNSGKYTKHDFENMHLSGGMVLENAGMKIKNSTLVFDSIHGSFVLHDNSVTVNSFYGMVGISNPNQHSNPNQQKSDFYLKGILKDALAFSFSEDADINVEATFHSNNLDLNEFLLNQHESSKRDTVYNIHFSPRLNFILNSDIGHLTFRKFEANNIRGTFQLRNQKLIGDPISFSTMDGSVTASGMIDNTIDSVLLITCDADLRKLNIYKLFYQFEDFGQHVITSGNLKGIGTADVQFASVWKPDLTVDPNKIYVRSNMSIEKGELLKYEPLKALSKYIEVSELEDIKFSTMQNRIEIKEQKIFIPKMDIQSSALDVTLSGTHTFNNEIDYHVKVLMSDILFQKARKRKKENNEFGVVEDDKEGKTSLFLSMTGTAAEPIIKYDKQGAKQNLKENIAQEKQTLKQILKEEFHWFKKDTTLNKKQDSRDLKSRSTEDGKFIIQWEEDEKGKDKKEEDDF